MLLRALPVEVETCRRRGSMNGVKEEEDLCFCMLLLDWLYSERTQDLVVTENSLYNNAVKLRVFSCKYNGHSSGG